MSEVWISSVISNGEYGNKLGIRTKFHNQEWETPSHIVPMQTSEISEAIRRHAAGEKLEREEFPEASYVFSKGHFKRTHDLFWAGGFMAIKGELARVLAEFDLGEGGGLIPYPIYEEDKMTPLEGPFFLVNFSGPKDNFLAKKSQNLEVMLTVEDGGRDLWSTRFQPMKDEIAVASSALTGADIWAEKKLWHKLFMSGRLVRALNAAKINVDFELARARLVDFGGAGK